MTLSPGTRFGPYEIVALLGSGGMGEVYKARDVRLGRDVAVKILPAGLSHDRARVQRFEQEARLIAALSHPHICALYDVGEHDGVHFLVMEYLVGETLAQRLARGGSRTPQASKRTSGTASPTLPASLAAKAGQPRRPLPVPEILSIATELASAMKAAHKAGIIHRDLKPDNVMLTDSGVKVLDFGVSKLKERSEIPIGIDVRTVTRTEPLTESGARVGTLPYMAPEQIEGREVDVRSDIFAFGSILYEMVAGRRAFAADTQADVITAILEQEPPPLAETAPGIPVALERLVRACLTKDPDHRIQDAQDLLWQLRWIAEPDDGAVQQSRADTPDTRRKRNARLIAATGLAVLGIIAGYVAGRQRMPPEPDSAVRRFQVAANVPIREVSVSPNGRLIAYVAIQQGGQPAIWIRSLDRLQSDKLPGTEQTTGGLFWSPDSRFLAFSAGGRLRKIAVAGGGPQDICASPGVGTGGSWGSDGTILFTTFPTTGVHQVSASGGEPRPVTGVQLAPGDWGHFAPRFLPGTRRFLYALFGSAVRGPDVCVGSLDSSEQRCLGLKSVAFDYLAPNLLVFARRDELFLQAFDPDTVALVGEPVVLLSGLSYSSANPFGFFGVGGDVLAVRTDEPGRKEQFSWYDRRGRLLETLGGPDLIDNFHLSPDARRVAFAQADSAGGGAAIKVVDIERAVTSLFMGGDSVNVNDPVWSRDGRQLAFTAFKERGMVMAKPAAGGAARTLFASPDADVYVEDWSTDGRYLAIGMHKEGRQLGAILPLHGKVEPIVFTNEGVADEFAFSPDARWLAYDAEEQGRAEVFVVPVPPTGERWQVSAAGGAQPRWNRDGRELFFLALDGTLMVATFRSAPSLHIDQPRALFKTGINVDPAYDQFDVAPDGRFLITKPTGSLEGTTIDVVLNWATALQR